MKRYRPLAYQFDFRPFHLQEEIKDEWEPDVQEHWRQSQAQIRESLVHEYGARDLDGKCERFKLRGQLPFSVIAFHNDAFPQIRDSYVLGSYYPALTGACALGELILNHLVLGLRESFRGTPAYKKVHRKKSIHNWRLAISALEEWDVLRPDVVEAFERLRVLRNRSIHFQHDTLEKADQKADKAIKLLAEIVNLQFGAFGDHPWFCSVPGVVFIKKAFETDPFVKLAYLPNCALVGPRHELETDRVSRQFLVRDESDYEEREISDEEFLQLFQEANKARASRDA